MLPTFTEAVNAQVEYTPPTPTRPVPTLRHPGEAADIPQTRTQTIRSG